MNIDPTIILERVHQLYPELIATRRWLHQHPEISFQEKNTTAFLKKTLETLGFELHTPLETGIIAVVNPTCSSKTVRAFRCDIDALPIKEEGEAKATFWSKNEGVAHCCGHDVHTTNLLGLATILSEYKAQLKHKIVLIFQPAEEKLPGGAKLLCETGILDELGVTEVYGLHTYPWLETGKIGIKEGALMARPDEFELTIGGKGGHAAKPHLALDPIVLAANLINSFQTIISRSVDPTEPAVITIGKIEGGTTYNIIPENVFLKGTIRTFSAETAEAIVKKMHEWCKGIIESQGGRYELQYQPGYPAVINTEKETKVVKQAVTDLFGEETLIELEKPEMAGEDFAFYQEHYPGAFFFLGSGSEEADSKWPWHHPKYNVDERAIPYAVAIFAHIAFAQ